MNSASTIPQQVGPCLASLTFCAIIAQFPGY